MIQRLRRKFMLIMSSLLSLALLVILLTVGFFRQTQLNNQVVRALDDSLKQEIGDDGGNEAYIPTIRIDYQINSQTIISSKIDWDPLELTQIINDVLGQEDNQGTLHQASIRYKKEIKHDTIAMAFVELNLVSKQMHEFILLLVAIQLGGSLFFVLLSLLLSNTLIKPVAESVKKQKQFVADASHELKNPLAVIHANTEILLKHPEDSIGHQAKWINNTKIEVDRMRELVNQLLFLAQTDAVSIHRDFHPVNLSDLVVNQGLVYESLLYEKQKELNLDIDPDLTILGDQELLKKLVAILLDNAMKYATANTSITFQLSQDVDHVILVCQNMSETIDPDDLNHLFERFYRVDKSRDRNKGGYGLGLAMAHEIVLLHHGTITATSLNQQTTFTIHFPIYQEITKKG